jgi:hypothetical protein
LLALAISSRQEICFMNWGPFLTSPLAPRGELVSQGWNLSPRGEVPPLVPPRGEHSLMFRRMEGRTENFTRRR